MTNTRMTLRRKGALFLAMVAAALIAIPALSSAAAQTAATVRSKPTVVLVHGAFADSSSWNRVIAKLRRDGYPVIAAANPLRDLAGDSAYVSSILSTIPGPVILVGHSYGGAVITDAATGHANVKALVYIAAFAPDQGESGLDILNRYPGSQLPPALVVRSFPDGQDAYLDPAAFHEVFAADVSTGEARLMAVGQRPVALAAFAEPSGTPAWKTIPSWFLVAGADHAIPPTAEQAMAQRAHAHMVMIHGASHAVLVSHPAATTDLIEDASRATS